MDSTVHETLILTSRQAVKAKPELAIVHAHTGEAQLTRHPDNPYAQPASQFVMATATFGRSHQCISRVEGSSHFTVTGIST